MTSFRPVDRGESTMVSDGDVSPCVTPMTGSIYQQRKEDGLCTRCGDPAAADRQLCQPHLDDQRARTKKSHDKARARRRKNGECVDCGIAAKQRRCAACQIKSGRHPRGNNRGNKQDRIAARLIPWENSPTNANRLRLRGGKKGRRSKSVDDVQDLTDAEAASKKGREGLQFAATPEVQALPRIQKLEASRAALSHVYHSVRLMLSVLVRHGEDVSEIASFIDEGDD